MALSLSHGYGRGKIKWGVLAERKTAAANAIGTAFHAAIDGAVMPLARVRKMWDIWRGLGGDLQSFKSIKSELHVWSTLHKYHGTFDAIGTLGISPELILFDWKTSAKIYPGMALQLAAYANAYEEMTGVKLKRGIIVLVSKDKPDHKLIVKEYKLDKLKFREFLQRKKEMEAYEC